MASPFAKWRDDAPLLIVAIAICTALVVIAFTARISGKSATDLTVRSNTAVEYFRVGVVIGATVERAKPGLAPNLLLPTALNYYGSLGPDPLLIVPQKESEVNLGKAAGALNKLKPPKTNETHTNLVTAVSTNTP